MTWVSSHVQLHGLWAAGRMAEKSDKDTRRATRRSDARRGAGVSLALAVVGLLAVVGVAIAAVSYASSANAGSGEAASPDGSIPREVVSDQVAPSNDVPASDSTDDAARQADLGLDPTRATEWLDHSNGEKTVYLTFDDGPSENTEKVLDILDKYGAHATFFVTGMKPNYYDMIGEAYRRGNTIGMHTFTHDYAICYASVDAYFADLGQIAQVVKDQIGYVPYLVRFPGGSSNTVSRSYCPGIMSTLAPELLARGYQYYDWNVSSGDGGGTLPVDELVANATSYGNFTNVILLCHDSSPKTTTVEALPQIIEYYQAQGFVFKAITRETVVVHHGIQN